MSEQPKRRWTLTTIAILVGWSLTLVGAVWAMSQNRTEAFAAISANATISADHEDRLRKLEATQGQIAADVRWIRKSLEQGH